MAKRDQWRRILAIDGRVRSGTFPHPDELAIELEVSRRTLFDDRNFMIEQLGAPLEFHRERRGWHYTEPTWRLPAQILTEGELLAFFLAARVAEAASNTPFAAELAAVVEKLRRDLDDPVTVDLHALAQTTFAAPPTAPVEDAQVLQLNRALTLRRKVRLRYRTGSSGQIKTRVVHPYHLHYARGEWLLLAHDELRDKFLTFNIARIESLHTLDDRFEMPLDFSAETVVNSMLWAEAGTQTFEVAVRFNDYQARFIRERTYHPAQQLEELEGDELILRFPASGLDEVARFVLGFGRHARVLEPPELVTLVREHITRMKESYEHD